MKWYKGKKRLAKKALSARHLKSIKWALSVKVGDYIGTCEGCNRKVAEINPIWDNEGKYHRRKSNRAWFIGEVEFTDTHGRFHNCPGGDCAYPKETPEHITNYFRGWCAPGNIEYANVWSQSLQYEKMKDAFAKNLPIVDQYGELLPEFDKYHS